jgi:hypothetical protein
MAWLRFGDDWNRKPEIRALDDASYRAFQCLIEAAEAFDACGLVTDTYAMMVYPHDNRRKLRERVRALADRGLVHLLDHPEDTRPGCPSCDLRMTEVLTEVVQKCVQKHPLSASTSVRSGRTEALVICIPCFFEVAMTPEAKREKRQKDAERQQRKRERDKTALSRRDDDRLSRPPVPVPVPELRDHDHRAPKEPSSAASPSTPSNRAADLDAGSWLRRELERRQRSKGKRIKWSPDHQPHIDSIVQKASEVKAADTIAILTAALDGFFEDATQQRYGYIAPGLDHGFATYAGPYLEQTAAEARERRIADAESRYQQAKAAAEAKHAREVAERARQREQNGSGPGPLADAVTETVQLLRGGKG